MSSVAKGVIRHSPDVDSGSGESARIGSLSGAGALQSASATRNCASGLQDAASGDNFNLTRAFNWSISADIAIGQIGRGCSRGRSVRKSSEALNRPALQPVIAWPWLFVLVVVAATFCLAASVRSASAECQQTAYRFFPGTPSVNTHWRVEKNEPCWHRNRTGRRVDIDNFVISQRALHGFAGVNNSIVDHGYAYLPAVGFVGKDHFQVTLDNHDLRSGVANKLTIDVDVEVVDAVSPK